MSLVEVTQFDLWVIGDLIGFSVTPKVCDIDDEAIAVNGGNRSEVG